MQGEILVLFSPVSENPTDYLGDINGKANINGKVRSYRRATKLTVFTANKATQ